MNYNSQNNNQSRARRRPDEINRVNVHPGTQIRQGVQRDYRAGTEQMRTGRPASQNLQTTKTRSTGDRERQMSASPVRNGTVGQRTDNIIFSSGVVRQDRRGMTAKRNVSALTLADEKSVIRREGRRLREEKKEMEWQKDIVRVRGNVDIFLLALILLLLALGTVAVFSASYPYALTEDLGSSYFIKHQLLFLGIGGAGMLLATLIRPKFYKKWIPLAAYAVSAVLLVAVLFIGSREGEAVRWIRIGSIGIQPSELMKVSIVMMLAWYADKYEKRMSKTERCFENYKWNTLIPFALLGMACLLVLIGKHLSGTIIIAGIGFLVLLVAGCKPSWLILTSLPVGVVGIGLFLLKNPYALKRITTFTDENADKLDELYQTTQSIYAIGNGGAFGVGLGESIQKNGYLGAAHTDFIFSVWCEEWGFVGAVVLIILFLLFMWRGYVIAVKAPDKFSMLTAFGITTHVGLQALLNMMVASDIIMNTGIPLPFFSYGGSSLIVLMVEMGILLSISRQSYKKKSEIEREEMMRKAGIIK